MWGKAIKTAREKLRMTKTALGKEIGVNMKTVMNWESGRYHPHHHNQTKLVEILGISPRVFKRSGRTLEEVQRNNENMAYAMEKIREKEREVFLKTGRYSLSVVPADDPDLKTIQHVLGGNPPVQIDDKQQLFREAWKASGLTRKKFAKKLGISGALAGGILKGEQAVSERTCKKLESYINGSEIPKEEEFAVYRGEEVLVTGTAKECAEKLGVKEPSIVAYATPSMRKRRDGRGVFAIRL